MKQQTDRAIVRLGLVAVLIAALAMPAFAGKKRLPTSEPATGFPAAVHTLVHDLERFADEDYYHLMADDGLLASSTPQVLFERMIAAADAGGRPGRFAEFSDWAEANRADALAALMPAGDIVPSLENARRWRELLTEWRAIEGLPPIPTD